MNPDTIGLYVHIPFCKKKCNYCDFCSYAGLDPSLRAGYLRALSEEIASYGGEEHPPVDTVFLGGGTPSLLTPVEIADLFAALRKTFHLLPDAEITAESNPGTLDREKIDAFCRAGVNRLSIGLQSVHESELRTLGRIHSYADFLDAYRLAKAGGIENIGVDLMYAFPGQTPASFHETLDTVVSLAPSHISAYGLIVEDGTPFGERREALILPDEDEELAMYEDACRTLAAAGYRHYEVSNYALPGRECRHNLRYWHEEEYIGFGVSAHSYYRGERFATSRDIRAYSEGKCKQLRTKEHIDKANEAEEYTMLALRTSEGVDLSLYQKRFSRSFLEGREESVARFVSLGLATLSDMHFALSERGFYVGNTLTAELL